MNLMSLVSWINVLYLLLFLLLLWWFIRFTATIWTTAVLRVTKDFYKKEVEKVLDLEELLNENNNDNNDNN